MPAWLVSLFEGFAELFYGEIVRDVCGFDLIRTSLLGYSITTIESRR